MSKKLFLVFLCLEALRGKISCALSISQALPRPRCLNSGHESLALAQRVTHRLHMKKDSSKSQGNESVHEFSEISLRPLDLSDIDDFMVWATDDKVSCFCTWDTYTNKEDGINFIKNNAIPHPWLKAICFNGRAIGTVSVTPKLGINDDDRSRSELGYALASKYWGKGIGTWIVKMVVSTIFKEWPYLERLEALVDIENVASQRALEKAGFQREGVLRKYLILKGRSRDVVIFSLLSTDPIS